MTPVRAVHLVPLLSLAGAAVVAGLALRPTEPYRLELDAPPPGDQLPGPELGIGTTPLEGRVLGEGRPVAGASVLAVQEGRPHWTETDGAGRFVLDELLAGEVEVAVNHPGYAPSLGSATAGAGPVTLHLGERVLSPPELPGPPAADLVGHARVPGVEDLGGYEVALEPALPADAVGGGVPRRVRLGADGSFRIPALTAAEYRVRLLPPEAAGGSWPDLLTALDGAARTIVHAPPFPAEPLELEAVCGAIAGAARDRATGGPLEGALVQVGPSGPGVDGPPDPRAFPAVQLDEQGRYRVPHLPPGRYRVLLTAGKDRREVDVVVPPGSTIDPDL